LIEVRLNDETSASCEQTSLELLEAQQSFCDTDCGASVVDILALVTPPARLWLDNNFGTFSNWFLFMETNNINTAFILSEIQGKRARVRTLDYTTNFALTSDIFDDIEALSFNANAIQTMNTSGADITVLITNQNYGSIFGIANSLNPNSSNKFCIAQVAFISPVRFTFAHEIAHQFGCLHSNPFTKGCSHGKNMENGRNTIMANQAPDNTRIQHFSNPDVSFGGETTGNTGTRNNAAQIRGAFCETANNNESRQFSVTINKVGLVCENDPFNASASVLQGYQQVWGIEQWCSGSYSYEWSWSIDPSFIVSYNIGNNSPNLYLASTPRCPFFYLRLKVTTSTGCETETIKRIDCRGGIPCRRSNESDVETYSKSDKILISPNPVSDLVQIYAPNFKSIKTIQLASISGLLLKNLRFDYTEPGKWTCDVSELPSGLWFIRLVGDQPSVTLKLAVAR
jgi:hypothetical protein